MKYARIYTGPDNESHYDDVEIAFTTNDFAPPAPPLGISNPFSAKRTLFAHTPVGWYGDWHPTPARQWWVLLAGQAELQTSDGEARQFTSGAVVLLEDTTGTGHRSRQLGGQELLSFFVQLAE